MKEINGKKSAALKSGTYITDVFMRQRSRWILGDEKLKNFCGSEKVPAGAGRSEAEWSCPNTGDGCNGILSLNDVHRGQRVITSSQLVYQPERDGEKKSQEEGEPATL